MLALLANVLESHKLVNNEGQAAFPTGVGMNRKALKTKNPENAFYFRAFRTLSDCNEC